MRRQGEILGLTAAAAACIAGCATIGHDFDVSAVPDIARGTTTKSEIVRMFGDPWRRGVEDGREAWTYGFYRFSMFGAERTKDLVVRFDGEGRVASYTFSSTEPGDVPDASGIAPEQAKP